MKLIQVKLIVILLFLSFGIIENVLAQTVYVTNTGTKYHVSSCRYLSKSSYSIALSEAVSQGYVACSVCGVKRENSSESVDVVSTQPASNSSPGSESTISTQCTGTTKSGNRCKRMTTDSSGRCYQH
jgi:hypothetical protein